MCTKTLESILGETVNHRRDIKKKNRMNMLWMKNSFEEFHSRIDQEKKSTNKFQCTQQKLSKLKHTTTTTKIAYSGRNGIECSRSEGNYQWILYWYNRLLE